eukprot:scaffold478885_cov22-Prasinocladus_malaysianus.AAC.1
MHRLSIDGEVKGKILDTEAFRWSEICEVDYEQANDIIFGKIVRGKALDMLEVGHVTALTCIMK